MLSHLFILNIAFAFIANLFHLKGEPRVIVEDGPYTRIALTDSTTMEIYESDTILVVFTACAPQCSSCARVYNKDWQLVRTIQPPFSSIFPLATIQNGQLVWTDNDTWNYQSTL
ncbi:MAG: hypothetical protein IKS76_06355 [Paludibacteraceae bacterium]|nr:hypothetical protein [Paludibacteraceae bacterium]MBR6492483.1 hypothetical protein [Paludibacteraceae bacterium]